MNDERKSKASIGSTTQETPPGELYSRGFQNGYELHNNGVAEFCCANETTEII